MHDKPGFPKNFLALTLVASVVISSFAGFGAGYIASGHADEVLSLLHVPQRDGGSRVAADAGGPLVGATEEELVVSAVKKVSPAVVSIVISKDVPIYEQYDAAPFGNNPFFQQFFGQGLQAPQYRQKGTQKKEIGAGSGFIVSADGYVVTNKHVVDDEQAQYTVVMQDGRKFPGKVLARDPSNDIAVVKIEPQAEDGKVAEFPAVVLGDSSSVQVGQSAIAIGYALGKFGNTVSTGVVSGLQRSITASGSGIGEESLFDVIQTDAAINPGNSGGPLLNLRGEAIGMDVAIVQGSQNIGFALPINDVKQVVESVKSSGKIVRPFLGVRYVLIDEDLQKQNQLTVDHGALVARGDKATDLAVVPGSPADVAGIVENDIILEVDGAKITVDHPLSLEVTRHAVGDTVMLKVMHKGETKTVAVKLIEKK